MSQRIYVVTESQEDEKYVLGVFSTYDKAQAVVDELSPQFDWNYEIEEFTLDEW